MPWPIVIWVLKFFFIFKSSLNFRHMSILIPHPDADPKCKRCKGTGYVGAFLCTCAMRLIGVIIGLLLILFFNGCSKEQVYAYQIAYNSGSLIPGTSTLVDVTHFYAFDRVLTEDEEECLLRQDSIRTGTGYNFRIKYYGDEYDCDSGIF